MLVYRACAAVLVVMAGVSPFTRARTTILRMRLCPLIFLTAAVMLRLPTVL